MSDAPPLPAFLDRRGGVPDNYDPEQGLKAASVAEAAEKYFARAKDTTKLYEAIEAKLGEQRRFVLWWDEQNNKGGNPTLTGLKRLEDYGVDSVTVHRWRTLYDLTRLDDGTWAMAMERGVIRPDMERKDLAPLLQEQRRQRNQSEAPVSVDTCTTEDLDDPGSHVDPGSKPITLSETGRAPRPLAPVAQCLINLGAHVVQFLPIDNNLKKARLIPTLSMSFVMRDEVQNLPHEPSLVEQHRPIHFDVLPIWSKGRLIEGNS